MIILGGPTSMIGERLDEEDALLEPKSIWEEFGPFNINKNIKS
jgi:hypothetical protein